MGTQGILAAAALFLMGMASAHASTVTINDTLSISYTGSEKPGFTDKLKSVKLTPGDPSKDYNFFTIVPASCSKSPCGTVTGEVSVTIDFTEPATKKSPKVTGDLTVTGTYQANYNGLLGCSSSTGKQTDCIDWTYADTPIPVMLSNGQILDVTLYDAQDWDITPKISFELDPTPLPATLPLFISGLGAIGLLGWRRKRTASVVAS